ncbi:MAG: hypothetical protein Q4D56_00345, partial [Bacteroides sp.]|nr:hypothetical protein [Bacteroides sp.]
MQIIENKEIKTDVFLFLSNYWLLLMNICCSNVTIELIKLTWLSATYVCFLHTCTSLTKRNTVKEDVNASISASSVM